VAWGTKGLKKHDMYGEEYLDEISETEAIMKMALPGLAGFCQMVEKRFFRGKNQIGKNSFCWQR